MFAWITKSACLSSTITSGTTGTRPLVRRILMTYSPVTASGGRNTSAEVGHSQWTMPVSACIAHDGCSRIENASPAAILRAPAPLYQPKRYKTHEAAVSASADTFKLTVVPALDHARSANAESC